MIYIVSIALIIVAIFFAVGIVGWWFTRRIKRLGADFVANILGHIRNHVSVLTPVQQVIEYDKILDSVLQKLGYEGTLAEKMKAYSLKNSISQSTWVAHKERNKLVHEVGYHIPEHEIQKHATALEQEVMRILSKKV